MSYKLRIEARHAQADPPVFEFTEATGAVGIGALGDWKVEGPGVAAVHAYMYFDGMTVFFAAAQGQSSLLAGEPLSAQWTPAEVPTKVELGTGGVKLAVKPPPSRRELAMQQARAAKGSSSAPTASSPLVAAGPPAAPQRSASRPLPPPVGELAEKTAHLQQPGVSVESGAHLQQPGVGVESGVDAESEEELRTVVGDRAMVAQMAAATAGGTGYSGFEEEEEVKTVVASSEEMRAHLLRSAGHAPSPRVAPPPTSGRPAERPRPPAPITDPEHTQELDEPAPRPRPPAPAPPSEGSATRFNPVEASPWQTTPADHRDDPFRSVDSNVYTSAPRTDAALNGAPGRAGNSPAIGVIENPAAPARAEPGRSESGPVVPASGAAVFPGSPGYGPPPAAQSVGAWPQQPGGRPGYPMGPDGLQSGVQGAPLPEPGGPLPSSEPPCPAQFVEPGSTTRPSAIRSSATSSSATRPSAIRSGSVPASSAPLSGIGAKLWAQWREASVAQRGILLMMPFAFVAVFIVFGEAPSDGEQADEGAAARASDSTGAPSLSATPSSKSTAPSSKSVAPSSPAAKATQAKVTQAKVTPSLAAAVQPTTSARPRAESVHLGKLGEKTDERQAVDALASGNAVAALAKYEELAKTHPDNPAFKAAAEILKSRAGN